MGSVITQDKQYSYNKRDFENARASAQDFSSILSKNKKLNFVDRLFNKDKYPVLWNPDGSSSTHQLASAEVDGMNIVYPMVIYDSKKNSLKKLSPEKAIQYALENNEYIKFPSVIEAEAFASGYKNAFPPDYFNQAPGVSSLYQGVSTGIEQGLTNAY